MPAEQADPPVPAAVQRPERVFRAGMVDRPAEEAARQDDRRIRQEREVVGGVRFAQEVEAAQFYKDRPHHVCKIIAAALHGRDEFHRAVRDAKIRKAGKFDDEQDDPEHAGQVAQDGFRLFRTLPFREQSADGGHGVVQHGEHQNAAGDHVDNAEHDENAFEKKLVDDIRNAGNADRHRRQRNEASQISARERTADAAQHEKHADDDPAHVFAHVPIPILHRGFAEVCKQGRSQKTIDRGHDVPQTIHKVIKNHQKDAHAPQKIDLPISFAAGSPQFFPRLGAQSGGICSRTHPYQFTIFTRRLSITGR